MNNKPQDYIEIFTRMKNEYLDELAKCLEGSSTENLARLKEAEDAYMEFIETYG